VETWAKIDPCFVILRFRGLENLEFELGKDRSTFRDFAFGGSEGLRERGWTRFDPYLGRSGSWDRFV